jgi:hypothetical protein
MAARVRASSSPALPTHYLRCHSVEIVNRSFLTWTLVALAGLAFAIGVGIAASNLASERIGLSSEPVTAGGELAPAAVRRPARPDRRRPVRKAPIIPAPSPPQPVPSVPAPDDSGSGVQHEHESEPDGDHDD